MSKAANKYVLDKKGREMLEPLLEATGYDSDESSGERVWFFLLC
jgi:hypothetical protein